MKEKRSINPLFELFDKIYPELNKAIDILGDLPELPTLKIQKKEENNNTNQ